MTSISIPKWVTEHRVPLSIGRPGTHARVATQTTFSLVEWLASQMKTTRQGRLTLDQYINSAKNLQKEDKTKAGADWYSFAHYEGGHRAGANWQGSNMVVLDADAKHGIKEGKEYSFIGAQLSDRLSGLQFIALPTHSYTEDIPRWRIAIPLSETVTDRSEYADIARRIAERLNGYVDPRSYTPEQFWFSLSAPRGEWQARLKLINFGN